MIRAWMTLQRLRATGRSGRRYLLALLCVWLVQGMQPCALAMPAVPAGVEHCPPVLQTDPPDHCPAMLTGHCRMSVDIHVDSSKTGNDVVAPAPAVVLALLDPGAPAPCLPPPDPGIRAGPQLHIRFCNLRN